MAFVKCTKCGIKISNVGGDTVKCPNCGHVMKLAKKSGQPQDGGRTKTCKHCKMEIPNGAKVCPHCRKKQGGVLKWVIIAFVCIGIIGAALGGRGDDSENVKPDATQEANVGVSSSENIEEEKEKSSIAPKENDEKPENDSNNEELTVGSSFEKNGLKITVNDADLDFHDYSDEYGMYKPADGTHYIMVSFTFENSGGSDSYVSIYDFKCYADNASCEQAYLPDDNDFINTNLSSGRNVSFQTYYQVPENAESIELEYETGFWTNKKAVIKLK